MRLFLDANILFSAARSDGAVRELLRIILAAGHERHVSAYVIEEARRNLMVKTPAGVVELEALLLNLHQSAVQVPKRMLETDLPLPDKDKPVLAAAISLGCDVLVTGDRTHFGPLYGRSIHGVAIHSPRSLAEIMLR